MQLDSYGEGYKDGLAVNVYHHKRPLRDAVDHAIDFLMDEYGHLLLMNPENIPSMDRTALDLIRDLQTALAEDYHH